MKKLDLAALRKAHARRVSSPRTRLSAAPYDGTRSLRARPVV